MKITIKKDIYYWYFVIIGSLVALINSMLFDNKMIGIVVAIAEVCVLGLVLVFHCYSLFLSLYIIFMATCLEFEQFVDGNLYNFKSIRIMGINLGIYILLPIIALAFLNLMRERSFLKKYQQMWSIAKLIFGINIVAMIVGLLGILANDNNIQRLSGFFGAYIGEVYEMMFLPVGLFGAMYMAIKFDGKRFYLVHYALQATLFALAVQMIIPAALGRLGHYGGTTYTLTSAASVFLPLALLLPFEKECLHPKSYFVLIAIANLFLLNYGASGKTIIVIGIIFVVIEIKLLTSKNRIMKILALLVATLVLGSLPIAYSTLSQNILFKIKFEQVIYLFSIGDGWLDKLPVSPKVRVGEFVNIFTEYIRKPWYLVTGKGFIGTIKDYSSLFANREISIDAFSDAEWNNGTFYGMHEMAQMLLTYGILGVVSIVKVIHYGIRNFKSNIWCVFAVYWFAMYYGYSMTLSTYGIVAFYFSFYICDSKINSKKPEHTM